HRLRESRRSHPRARRRLPGARAQAGRRADARPDHPIAGLEAPRGREKIAAISFRSRHTPIAAALALCVVAAGVIWNTRTAAGADAYGYVSQADLWLSGSLHIDQQFAGQVPWPLARWTFTPLGYRPEPDGFRIVPTYSPGLPMLMALAKTIAGQCAIFWIVPLAGGVLTFATYWIGARLRRPWVGVTAAWLVATSPTILFMAMAPMSDVPAAAAWAAAVALALSDAPLGAAASGVAASIAILIRPNLVPLAAILAVWIVCRDGLPLHAARVVRVLAFALPMAAGATAVAAINARLYGSPLASGYGDLSDAYALSYVVPNLARYGAWLLMAETPLALAGLVTLVVPSTRVWTTPESQRARWLLGSVAAGAWVSYLLYVPWDAWWYLRFLLPAWPMMALGVASLLAGLAAAIAVPRVAAIRAIVVVAIVALGLAGVRRAIRLNVFDQQSGEAKY